MIEVKILRCFNCGHILKDKDEDNLICQKCGLIYDNNKRKEFKWLTKPYQKLMQYMKKTKQIIMVCSKTFISPVDTYLDA